MIRLLCVEDDPLVQAYLSMRLALEADIRVVSVVPNAGEALTLLRTEPVDMILLDYQLEGADGLQLLAAVVRAGGNPSPRVLFCTGLASPELEANVRGLGGAGVVNKTRMSTDLLPALRAVAQGRDWFGSEQRFAAPVRAR